MKISFCGLTKFLEGDVARQGEHHFVGSVVFVQEFHHGTVPELSQRLLGPQDIPSNGVIGVEQLLGPVKNQLRRRIFISLNLTEDHLCLLFPFLFRKAGMEKYILDQLHGPAVVLL